MTVRTSDLLIVGERTIVEQVASESLECLGIGSRTILGRDQ